MSVKERRHAGVFAEVGANLRSSPRLNWRTVHVQMTIEASSRVPAGLQRRTNARASEQVVKRKLEKDKVVSSKQVRRRHCKVRRAHNLVGWLEMIALHMSDGGES